MRREPHGFHPGFVRPQHPGCLGIEPSAGFHQELVSVRLVESYTRAKRCRMKPLVLIGDEAWTPDEWEMRKRRLVKRRQQYRDSKRRAKLRDERPQPVGWFHSLACSGNGHRRKPSCIPIPVFSRKVT